MVIGEAGNTLTLSSGALLEGGAGGGTIIGGNISFGSGGEGFILSNTANAFANPAPGLAAVFYNQTTAAGGTGAKSAAAQIFPSAPNFGASVPSGGGVNTQITTRVDPNLNDMRSGTPAGVAGLSLGISGPSYPLRPPGVQGSNQAAQWVGFLNVCCKGSVYTIYGSSDDACAFYADSNRAPILSLTNGAANFNSATVSLAPGYHPILQIFDQGGGNAHMELMYSGPDTNGLERRHSRRALALTVRASSRPRDRPLWRRTFRA